MLDLDKILDFANQPEDSAPPASGVEGFLKYAQPIAERVGERIGVDPDVLIGQWGLETGWGKSVIPGTNNFGNIKDFSGSGVAATDNMTGSRDKYRAYASADEFGHDYAGLIERKYASAINSGADAQRFAEALKRGGYAEDPEYVKKLARAAGMVRAARGGARENVPTVPVPAAQGAGLDAFIAGYDPTKDTEIAQEAAAQAPFLVAQQRKQAVADESPVSTSLKRGVEGLTHNVGLFVDNLAGDSEGIAKRVQDKQKWDLDNPAPSSSQKFVKDWADIEEGEYGQMFGAFLQNPGGAFNQMVEQTPNSAPGMALQVAAFALASTGVGAPAALALQGTAAFIGNLLPEGGAFVQEQMQRDGVDTNDLGAIVRWAEQNRGKNLQGGVTKAGVISVNDAVAAFLGNKLISGPTAKFLNAEREIAAKSGVDLSNRQAAAALRSSPAYQQAIAPAARELLDATTTTQKIMRGLGATAIEGVGEGTGEYTGSLAATGEASGKDAILEGMMGVGQSTMMAGAQTAINAFKGPDQGRAQLEKLAQMEKKPNSPVGNAAKTVAEQNPPAAAPAEPQPSAFDTRLESARSMVEDKAFIQALRGTEGLGPESVTEVLSAFAKARNPNLDPMIRERALTDLEGFIQTFANRPNFTMRPNAPEQEAAGTGTALTTGQAPQGGPVGPAITPDDGMTLDGTIIQRPPTMAGANPNQLSAPPVLGLESPEQVTAKRDADAEYEQAFQDLVKAEALGQSGADLEQIQRQLIESDARLRDIQAAIEGNQAAEAEARRRAVLSEVLADPRIQNPAEAFAAALRRAGIQNTQVSDAERARIARFAELRSTFTTPEIEPSAPNEFDPYQSPSAPAAATPAARPAPAAPRQPAVTPQAVREAVLSGARLDGNRLAVAGTVHTLKGPLLAAAKKAERDATQQDQAQAANPQNPEAAVPPAEELAVAPVDQQEAGPQAQPVPAAAVEPEVPAVDPAPVPAPEPQRVGQAQQQEADAVAVQAGQGPAVADPAAIASELLTIYQRDGKDAANARYNAVADEIRASEPETAEAKITEIGATFREMRKQAEAEAKPAAAPKPQRKKKEPASVNEAAQAEQSQPPAQEEATDAIDAELSDALAHLGEVLADIFPGNVKMMPGQNSAKDLLPALSKVIELLVKKGFKSFRESVGAASKAMRSNTATAPYVDQVSARQWKAAYNSIADFHAGTDSESDVAALSADDVARIVGGSPAEAPKAEIKSELDAAAHEAATSPLNDRKEPTQKQDEAENFKFGKHRLFGMEVSIKNPIGSVRKGTDRSGKAWERSMSAHYGHFPGTTAADGDNLDVFLTSDAEDATKVWVIDQIKKDGTFDESKVVAGPKTEAEAKALYLAHYPDDWTGLGAITSMPVEAFKAWAMDGKKKRKALAYVEPKTTESEQTAADSASTVEQTKPSEPAAEPQSSPEPFDSAKWDKDRADRIKASKESGNRHLDDVRPSVETMRGKEIYYAHNPKQRGVVRTVDNYGNVYVDWSDKYSAEKELASETLEDNASWLKASKDKPFLRIKRGNQVFVMRSTLGRSDLKDYVFAGGAAPVAAEPQAAQADATPSLKIQTFPHTKTGKDQFVVQLPSRISREDYQAVNRRAVAHKGRYSKFSTGGAIPGFLFQSKEAAEAFAGDAEVLKVAGQAAPAPQSSMTYGEFKAEMQRLLNESMKYKPSEVGAGAFAEKMADLSDQHPEFQQRLDAESDGMEVGGIATPLQTQPAKQSYDENVQTDGVGNEQARNDRGDESALAAVPPGELQGTEVEGVAGERGRGLRGSDAEGDGSSAADVQDERAGGVAGEPQPVLPERPDEVVISGESRPLDDVAEAVKNDPPSSEPKPKFPSRFGDNPGNYRISEADSIGSGTPGERIRANMAAIRTVLELERENRYPTKEEQAALAKYVGWGGIKNVFKGENSDSKQEREAYAELKRILTPDQLFWMGQSVLDAHYTSPTVVRSIYRVLDHFGVSGGRFLEPTVGVGNFIGMMPEPMASGAKWYASEIDPITSLIAKHLYPEAQILPATGFQDAEFPYGRMDVAIGNPPFGDQRITDTNKKRAEINGFKIHNYIISKSAMHLRPGGVMAFVVTSRFLDTANPEAREFLAKNFRMLAAIRLPNTAFKENAGTEVTTDIIFMQRRREDLRDGVTADDMPWLDTKGRMLNEDGDTVTLNRYFAENPDMMLGKPTMAGTMYGSRSEKGEFALLPREGSDIAADIESLLAGPEMSPLKDIARKRAVDAEVAAAAVEMNREDIPIGGFLLENGNVVQRVDDDDDGNVQFRQLTADTPWTEKQSLGQTRIDRIRGMLQLRAAAYDLMASERADDAQDVLDSKRKALNALYDAFVDEFGFLNDNANFALMSEDPRIEFGLEANHKKQISAARAKALGQKPAPASAEKSSLLKERVFYPKREILSADSPRDAYSISLSERGRLDIKYIAELTDMTEQEVIADLSSGPQPLIYRDPALERWVQEDEYLSGNVKAKLKMARGAGLAANISALEAIQPKDVPAEDIHAEFGATWIAGDIYEEFLKMLGYGSAQVAVLPRSGAVEAQRVGNPVPSVFRSDIENPDYSIDTVFSAVANRRPLIAYDRDGDNRVVNRERTENLARIRQKLIAIWNDWIKADPTRATSLARDYNEKMNTTVERKFDGVTHLRTVGANPAISLRNSQKNSAWRMVQSSTVLLDHVVGAGKTIAITTGLMERKRLGLSKKPMVVVPNHLVGQWARDWMALYPGANILAATEKDFQKKNRRRLFARIATGKFDAIIVGHSSFGFIPVSREAEVEFIRGEVEHLEAALTEIKAAEGDGGKKGDSRRVRAIKNRIAKRMEKIRELQDKPRDNVATFEDMGVDYIAVDEMHEFKNLEYATQLSNVAGMGSPEGSKKAFDMYMKIRLLQERGGGVAGATGTPISNSMVEMYSLLRYLNPGALAARGLEQFDAWVKAHGTIEPRDEYTPAGKVKQRTVMALFNNLPELLQMYKQVADTVTMTDLKRIYAEQIRDQNATRGTKDREEFPVPKVKGGGRALDMGAPTPEQVEFMDYLIARADILERLKGKERQEYAKIDNALWLMNDARKMSLDVRIIDPTVPDSDGSKVSRAAKRIKEIYDKTDVDLGAQLVFCDLSTPAKNAGKDASKFIQGAIKSLGFDKDSGVKTALDGRSYEEQWAFLLTRAGVELDSGRLDDAQRERIEEFIESVGDDEVSALRTADNGFSVYDDLRTKLIDAGIPEREVAFIHDASTAEKKRELFDLVNAGKVRVLIGSSAKMGAGTNAQRRLVALHHMDAPWRPSDIEQREGRIIRQGNMFYERNPDKFEVEIVAYSTERTFDAQMWGVLARKASFLEQFRNGLRTIKEESSDSASYAEFMAEATGNEIFRDKLRLEREINDLEAEDRSSKMKISAAERVIQSAAERRGRIEASIEEARRLGAIQFNTVTFGGKTYRNDLSAVMEEETQAYRSESEAYEQSLEKYKIARKAWEDAAGTERGRPPEKPAKPEAPEYNSERVLARSEWAQFMDAITRNMALLTPESGPREYDVIADGNLPVTIKASPSSLGEEVKVSIAGETLGYAKPRSGKMFMILGPRNVRAELSAMLASAQRSQQDLERGVAQAELTLKNVTPVSPERMAEVRERYEEVKREVDAVSARMAAERSQRKNRFIEKDGRRFAGADAAATAQAEAMNQAVAAYKYRRVGTDVLVAESPKGVDIPGFQKFKFFSVNDKSNGWFVIEETTGLSVGKGKTRKDAVAAAEATLSPMGEEKLAEAVARAQAISDDEKRAAVQAFAPAVARATAPEADGVPLSEASSLVDGFLSEYPEAPNISVVQSYGDLPVFVREDLESQGVPRSVRGTYVRGQVYVVAGNHDSIQDLEETVFHEVLGHLGVRKLFGPEFVQKLNQVFLGLGGIDGLKKIMEARGNGGVFDGYVRRLIAANRNDPKRWTEDMTRAVLTEEVFAFIAEKGSRGLYDRFMSLVGMVRDFLRRTGLVRLAELGESDLLHTLAQAREGLRGSRDTGVSEGAAVMRDGSDTITVDGVERPRMNSEGRPIHPTEEGIRNFWRWFSGSEVVDDQGRPLVVYHWTEYEFDEFDTDANEGSHFGTKQAAMDRANGRGVVDFEFEKDEEGWWAWADSGPLQGEGQGPFAKKSEAQEFAKKNRHLEPVAAYLRIESHRKVEDLGMWGIWPLMQAMPRGTFSQSEIDSVMDADNRWAEFHDAMRRKGVDGLAYTNTEEDPGSTSYIAFSPNQIKSATGNNGDFDPSSPSIVARVTDDPADSANPSDNEGKGENDGTLRAAGPRVQADEELDRSVGGTPRMGWGGATRIRGSAGPATVYRGASRPLEAGHFDESARGVASGNPSSGLGVWFSADRDDAATYGTVEAFKLDIRRPKIYTADKLPAFGSVAESARHQRLLKSQGFDGIVIDGREFGGPINFVAFDAQQAIYPDSDGPRGGGEMPAVARAIDNATGTTAGRVSLMDRVADHFSTSRTFNWWQRTVGSQYGKAKKSPEFAAVFDKAKDFISDVSRFANRAADAARSILPHMDSYADIGRGFNLKRQWSDAKDYQEISEAIFQGTLESRSYTRMELADRFGLDERQMRLYDEFRGAVRVSLDDLAASELARAARAGKLDVALQDMSLDDALDYYTGQIDPMIETAQEEIDAIKLRHEIEKETLDTIEVDETFDIAAINAAKRDRDARQKAEIDEAMQDVANLIEFRNSFTDKVAKIRELQNQGYAPLMRFGQFTVDVVRMDEDGNVVMNADGEPDRPFFGMFESQSEANEAAKIMAEEYPGYAVNQGILSTKANELYRGVTPETAEMFARMLGTNESDAFQAYLKQAVANRSAMRRLIKRKGMAGFSKDVPRVLAAFLTSNARLASGNWHFGEMARAVQDIPQHMGDVKDEAIKLTQYVQNPQEEAAALRGFLFFSFLGGSVASALVNTTQTFTTTIPYLSQFGSTKKTTQEIASAMKMAGRMMLKDGIDTIEDRELRAALLRASVEGVTDPQEVHLLMAESGGSGNLAGGAVSFVGDLAGAVSPAAKDKIKSGVVPAERVGRAFTQAWGSLFGAAEKYNRHVAFIAAWKMAPPGVDRYEFAANAVDETQFRYTKESRPNWARGAVGATIFTFKTFIINYLEFLSRLPRKQQAIALGVLVMLAGVSGLPGMDDMDDLVDAIGQKLGYNWNNKAGRHAWLVKTFGTDASNFIEHGISAALWLDVSGRLSVGNIIPGTGAFKKSNENGKARDAQEFFGPAASVVAGAFDVFDDIGSGKSMAEMLRPVAPKMFNDIYQAVDILQSGQYRDRAGRNVVDAGPIEAAVKLAGFHPNRVAEPRRVEYMLSQSAAMVRAVRSDIHELLARGRFERDSQKEALAREMQRNWNRRNPTTPIYINPTSIQSRVKAMRATSAERLVKATPKDMRGMLKAELSVE